MGMTVHYSLRLRTVPARSARALVEKLHRRARALPLDRVYPIRIYSGPRRLSGQPEWFRTQLELLAFEKRRRIVFPERAYAFAVHPGRGCESASFGLLRYPKVLELADGRRVPTNVSGWWWQDFCKTQYASNPRHGGFENFRRCHLSLVALLDAAAKLGLKTKVSDESAYASLRDMDKLRLEIAEWNELIAGFVGRLKDGMPGASDAPIMEYPDFEHLEARGRRKRP
jgi:hypothetical protein